MRVLIQTAEEREGRGGGRLPSVRRDGADQREAEPVRGPQAGPERTDVPLPAPEATDDRNGKVGHRHPASDNGIENHQPSNHRRQSVASTCQ